MEEDQRKKSIVEEQGPIIIHRMFSLVKSSLQFERMMSYGYERVGTSTGIIYDERMGDYYCEWDSTFSECPDRFHSILLRLEDLDILNRCVDMKPMRAKEPDVTRFHDYELLEELKKIAKISDVEELKKMSEEYERIYLHPNVFKCAMLAAGCSIELTKSVFYGKLKNGMAIVRPPGHHSLSDTFSGHCFINNPVLSAHAGFDMGAQRVLIVDWDVNHGHGVQRAFYDSNRVLYFSIHRYDHGRHWPHLRESDYDHIGAGNGEGYNVNVPLNSTGNGDAEYLAIFRELLMPLAYEYRPNLIVIAAGYNAAVGCIEGEMNVSPACFSHLTHSLCALANGKVVVLLEGGSFIPSLTEGVAQTVLTLIGNRVPRLPSPYKKPKDEVLQTIQKVKCILRDQWKCFEMHTDPDSKTPEPTWKDPPIKVESEKEEESHPMEDEDKTKELENKFEDMISNLPKQLSSEHPTHENNHKISAYLCFSSDEEKLDPEYLNDSSEKVIWLPTQKALKEELEWLSMQGMNVKSSRSSLLAAGAIFQVMDTVLSKKTNAGISLINHTNETGMHDVGPIYGKLKHKIPRTMSIILNDGMISPKRNSFPCEDDSILRFNILHSHEEDECNPFLDASDDHANKYDVTIRLGKYTQPVDSDYLNLIYRILLPIGYEYSPDIVIIYASLGSGSISPIGFSHLIYTLSSLANSRMVVIFEGGCNPFETPRSLHRSVKTLLKHALPNFEAFRPSDKNTFIIEKYRRHLKDKWESLQDYNP